MSIADREKWNDRYQRVEGDFGAVHPFLEIVAPRLPPAGAALEIAGGRGRNALWLAERGWSVKLSDISEVGLRLAEAEAGRRGLQLETQILDFDEDPLPVGPFDLVVCTYFVHRPLFAQVPVVLRSGGAFAYVHATRSNLQRHDKPPAGFLLDDGELPRLISGLNVETYLEGWTDNNVHEARLLAIKP